MVAALVRWQFCPHRWAIAFTDAPAERVIGNAGLREKGATWRNWAGRLSPRSVPRCNWYSTTLTGITPSARAWRWGRAVEGTVAVEGRRCRRVGYAVCRQPLDVLLTGTDANPIMITRWVGALYRFTSGTHSQDRLIINQTPQSIMTVLIRRRWHSRCRPGF